MTTRRPQTILSTIRRSFVRVSHPFAVVGLALLGSQVFAAPPTVPEARKALTPLYAGISKAFLARDLEGVLKYFGAASDRKPGEKGTDPKELRTKFGTMFIMLKEMKSAKMEIAKLTVVGDRVVVLNRYSYVGVIEPERGRTVKAADQGVTRDTWARTAKGWRIIHLETLKSNPTFNGKPIDEVMKSPQAPPKK